MNITQVEKRLLSIKDNAQKDPEGALLEQAKLYRDILREFVKEADLFGKDIDEFGGMALIVEQARAALKMRVIFRRNEVVG